MCFNRLFIALILFICGVSNIYAKGFSDESLHYVVSYKWGLVNKDAGEATLALKRVGNNYDITLSAKTKPWADRFYNVRDTLVGRIRTSDLRPLSYSKIAHEKGRYSKDVITFSFTNEKTIGLCKRYRKDKNGNISTSEKTLETSGPAYDMLSIFYYLREIDYENLNNKPIKATVFSGSKAETITIRLIGKEKITLRDNSVKDAYHLKFNFTSNNRKKSSDDIDTWISADSRHIPLYLIGQLPVGQVRVHYIR